MNAIRLTFFQVNLLHEIDGLKALKTLNEYSIHYVYKLTKASSQNHLTSLNRTNTNSQSWKPRLEINYLILILITPAYLIMVNLHIARDRVSQIETVCMRMLKLAWNKRNMAQAYENFKQKEKYLNRVSYFFKIFFRQKALASFLDISSYFISTVSGDIIVHQLLTKSQVLTNK